MAQGAVPAASFKPRLTKWSSAARVASPLQRRVRPYFARRLYGPIRETCPDAGPASQLSR